MSWIKTEVAVGERQPKTVFTRLLELSVRIRSNEIQPKVVRSPVGKVTSVFESGRDELDSSVPVSMSLPPLIDLDACFHRADSLCSTP